MNRSLKRILILFVIYDLLLLVPALCFISSGDMYSLLLDK